MGRRLAIADRALGLERKREIKSLMSVRSFHIQAVGVLKHVPPGAYNVTVVSDANYNLFTPLLREPDNKKQSWATALRTECWC